MHKIGYPSWRLALCLLGAWLLVFSIIAKGVKSSGKASYFLAMFPYVIMITLLIRAVTLEGATKGILYFITPQWHELSNPKVILIEYFFLHFYNFNHTFATVVPKSLHIEFICVGLLCPIDYYFLHNRANFAT